mgnify:CR=1 FL=1
MHLPKPSDEQKNIIKYLENYNVVIDSVAGSGKTTTNLHIALKNRDLNILLLTYNARLKIETTEKVEKLGLSNMEVRSYHSFCVKHYDKNCYTDVGIRKYLDKRSLNRSEIEKKFNYDIIIIDEAQDMCNNYFELVCQIFRDNSKKAKICILGDRNQSIFAFNNADERFIVFAKEIYKFNKFKWKETKLSESFRVTYQMAEFINNSVLGFNRMISHKQGTNVKYLICDPFTTAPLEEIKNYLRMGYRNDEIFVLAPSVRSPITPVRILANSLTSMNIPIYVPSSDEEKIDDDIMKNKIVFSTFHQTKGLERKVVMVYGFDASYFKYYKQNLDQTKCPNELYVAITRASEKLCLIHSEKSDFLQFIKNPDDISDYCDVYGELKIKDESFDKIPQINVTDITKHLPFDIIQNALSFIDIRTVRTPKDVINIRTKIKTKFNNVDTYENVSDITGIAIPSYFEYKKYGHMTIYDLLIKNKQKINPETVVNSGKDKLTTKELLKLANYWNSFKSGYRFKTKQIKRYDWLNMDDLRKCYDRLDKLIVSDASFEVEFTCGDDERFCSRKIVGVIDCINGEKVYEFKCVKKIDDTHILQLAIYSFLIMEHIKNRTYDLERFEKYYDEEVPICCRDDSILFLNNGSVQLGRIKKLMDLNYLEILDTYGKIHKIRMEKIIDNLTLRKKIECCKKELKELDRFSNGAGKYYLYNILNDNLLEISSTYDRLSRMVQYLMESKYKKNNGIDDNDFIELCNNTLNKFNFIS